MNKNGLASFGGSFRALCWAAVLALLAPVTAAQFATVDAKQKISQTAGGFEGALDALDEFGNSVESLGDLDGDGIGDLAVGCMLDRDASIHAGAVWILFLNADGTVSSEQKISALAGGLVGPLEEADYFGADVAALGDLNGDGTPELAVSASGDDDGGAGKGAVWILSLNSDGTVDSEQKISSTTGGFGGAIQEHELFGSSLAALGDLDGNGIGDLAVGAIFDHDLNDEHVGAVWILFLNADGTVAFEQEISSTAGGFTGLLDSDDRFGDSVAAIGDIDGDGIQDLAVGASGTGAGNPGAGAIWILFLNSDGTVAAHQQVSQTLGGLGNVLDADDAFGFSIAALGDLDRNGIGDVAVGAPFDDDGGGSGFTGNRGALWILFLNADGTVSSKRKISATQGGFGSGLDPRDAFGRSVAALGDLDGDGMDDLVVGATNDDDGDDSAGALWILFLEEDTVPPVLHCPPDFGVLDAGTPGRKVFFPVFVSDDVDSAPTVHCVPPSGSFFPRGTTTVVCTATDDWGNQSVCAFSIAVEAAPRRHDDPDLPPRERDAPPDD